MNKLSNYFKLEKYYNFLRKYPRIQNLSRINNKFLKFLILEFYLYLVKQNNKLRYFFFEKYKEVDNIWFNVNDLVDGKKELFESLSQNGIVILKNAINDSQEILRINNYFEEITSNKISSDWITSEVIDASSIKYKGEKKNVEILYMRKNIKYLPKLEELSRIITKKIFGSNIDTSAEFFVHNCKLKEENTNIYEDTNFHIDRYLPCLKIIYSPNEILSNEAPFGFIKKTHKLNNKFMRNFIVNSKDFIIKNNEINENLENDIINLACPANSLIITFTNGLHKRNVFLKNNTVRKTIFFQYTEKFNTFSLFNFKKFNKSS